MRIGNVVFVDQVADLNPPVAPFDIDDVGEAGNRRHSRDDLHRIGYPTDVFKGLRIEDVFGLQADDPGVITPVFVSYLPEKHCFRVIIGEVVENIGIHFEVSEKVSHYTCDDESQDYDGLSVPDNTICNCLH